MPKAFFQIIQSNVCLCFFSILSIRPKFLKATFCEVWVEERCKLSFFDWSGHVGLELLSWPLPPGSLGFWGKLGWKPSAHPNHFTLQIYLMLSQTAMAKVVTQTLSVSLTGLYWLPFGGWQVELWHCFMLNQLSVSDARNTPGCQSACVSISYVKQIPAFLVISRYQAKSPGAKVIGFDKYPYILTELFSNFSVLWEGFLRRQVPDSQMQ